ncbi:MAG TPA: nucleotidyl transferase AbiEii/AbiGii toxin family protein [Anaerolineales bacterium]|nr:nucleotidyl transferase AbiEii/AbiGii toxin family protein [Anaerolineales bacterium]
MLENLIELLKKHGIRFCVIGGQAVNAYAEPLVSLDLDLVVAGDQLDRVRALFEKHFVVRQFPHSLNVTIPDSDVRVQIRTDERYSSFLERAAPRSILGMELPVASVEDVLQGKIWTALNPESRSSKRQKDLADIARILENYPQYRSMVPREILKRLLD